MTTQLELGEQLKSAGTTQVLNHNDEYKDKFFAEANWLLRMQGTVTAEEVVDRIGMPKGHVNAIGAAMRAFAKQNKLVVICYRKAAHPLAHARMLAVWAKPII